MRVPFLRSVFHLTLRTHHGDSAILIVSSIVFATLCRAASARFIAQPIGPELFGILSVSFSWVTLCSGLATVGFVPSMTVLVLRANEHVEIQKLVGGLSFLLVLLALPLVLATRFSNVLLGDIVTPEQLRLIQTASPLLIFLPLSNALPLFMPATGNAPLVALSKVLHPALWLAIGSYSVRLGRIEGTELLAAYLISACVSAVLITASLKPSISQLGTTVSRLVTMNREYGIHQYLGKVVTVASGQLMSLLLVPIISGAAEYGFFVVSQTVGSVPYLILLGVFQSRARQIGKRRHFTRNEFAFALAAATGAGLLISVVSRQLVLALWGTDFGASISWVPWLALASSVQAVRLPFSFAISSWSDPNYKFVTMGGDFVRLVVNAILIVGFGVPGAVAAIVISELLCLSIVSSYYRKNVCSWSAMSAKNRDE